MIPPIWAIVRQLLRAHEYWRLKRLAVDLVILNERAASYVQDLQSALESAAAHESVAAADRRGGCARLGIRSAHRSHCPRDAHDYFRRLRAWCWPGARGTLAEQLDRLAEPAVRGAAAVAPAPRLRYSGRGAGAARS